MVRINLLEPRVLTDQHLNAENVEILMLKGTNLKGEVPSSYRLGKGHMLFFKDKKNYLTLRQYEIKTEMIRRGFKCSVDLPLIIGETEFKPSQEDFKIIIKRLIEKVKLKPSFYNFYGKKINAVEYIKTLNNLLNENTVDKKINLGGKKTTFIKVTIAMLLFISSRIALYISFL